MFDVCTVLHSVPGRTRLRLNHISIQPSVIEAKIRNIPGIISVTYSKTTNTAVLYHKYHYFPKKYLAYIHSSLHVKPANLSTNSKKEAEGTVKEQAKELGLVLGAYVLEKMMLTSHPVAILTPTSLAVLYASRSIIKKGIVTLKKPTPDTLTTASLLASLIKGSPKSAFIIYFMSTISEILTEYTMNRTRGFVKEMMQVDTSDAWLVTENGQEIKVAADYVKKGDKIVVFQGEKIPFDGVVTNYSGHVDQSSITGEYMPAHVSEGSYVYAGSIVTNGKIMLEVDKIGEDLTVNRMIKLIEEAQDKQASIQTMSEQFTEKMVPVSFALAAAIYLVTKDWNRVLNMLVIDYVCGVKLSTATAISASIGKAARKGILVKGGQTLETLSKVNTVVFDKTGTITEGRPTVKDILTYNGYLENEVLAYAASAEEHSSHPIAEAILNEASSRKIHIPEHHDHTLENIVGKGVSVYVNDEHVIVGSRTLLEDFQIELPTNVKSGVFVAKEKKLIGIFEIEDQVRPGMNRSMNQMRRSGVDEMIMLTGDYKQSAQEIADRISVDEFIAEAMPQDKANFVQSLNNEEKRVTMMVGDGINDAPALAYADIGVTLGAKKTDIAIETSDIVIHSDNPMLLAEVVQLSQQSMSTIKQNIVATLLINTAAITFGSFGIFPPMIGAAIHNAATIGVVLNSAKLLVTDRGRK